MTKGQAREIFNQAIEAAVARGDANAVAKIELCREYFTNEAFRGALEAEVWAINNA